MTGRHQPVDPARLRGAGMDIWATMKAQAGIGLSEGRA